MAGHDVRTGEGGDVHAVSGRHTVDEQRLAAYLAANVAGFEGPMSVVQFSRGQSNPTYLLTTPSRKYVLRKKPSGVLLPTAHMIEREYRVLSAFDGSPVPAPRVHVLCEDTEVIGAAFYVMEFLDGRIFKDPRLPGMTQEERRNIYRGQAGALAELHRFDWRGAGLADFGKTENYIARQIDRWTRQFQASEVEPNPSLQRLSEWLPGHIPASEAVTIAHGDYHLQNVIFHPAEPRVIGIVDWELSTLGNPFADLAYNTMIFHLPASTVNLGGLADSDLARLGIPSEREYLDFYRASLGRDLPDNWRFYLAFAFFRCAAIAQGVYARAAKGNASAENAFEVGRLAWPLADAGWAQAQAA